MAQEKNNRLFLSVSDADLYKLDILREELGMNRSQYIRYLISGQKRVLIPSVKYKELVSLTDSDEMITRTVHVLERNELASAEAIMNVTKKELLKCRNCGDVMADLILKIADILRNEK